MAIDKAIKYKDQKLTKKQKKKIKPANQGGGPNYLGKQETVTVPKKWLSDPDHVVAELAYITPKEQKILLNANIYGSLDGKPNKGPGGIMSLQGDLGGFSAPAGGKSGGSKGKGGAGSSSYKDTNYYKMMTGQKNIGQTTKTGPKTRKYAVPEYVNVKQPGGGYKNTYIGSGYKSYGTPSFFGNLFSRGAPGYRGIKGMPTFFGKPGFDLKQGPDGMGYYSDKENFGETRDAFPKFGLMGLISSIAEKFKKPKDMSEFNKLGLLTDRVNPTFQNDLENELMLSTQKTPEKFLPNAGPKKVNIPASDAVSTLASSKFNRMKGYTDDYPNLGLIPSTKEIPTVNGVPMIDTGSVYQDNLDFFNNLNKGLVVNNEPPMVNTDNVMQGSVLDAQPKKGILQMISDAFISPAGADEFDMEAFQKAGADKGFFGANDELEAMKEYYDAAKSLTAPGGKFAGANDPAAVRNFITQQSAIPFGGGSYGVEMGMIPENFMNKTEDFTTQKDPLSFFADGGLASMFTRRG